MYFCQKCNILGKFLFIFNGNLKCNSDLTLKIKWNENISIFSLSKEFADSLCRNQGKTGFDLLKNILEGITLLRFEKGT